MLACLIKVLSGFSIAYSKVAKIEEGYIKEIDKEAIAFMRLFTIIAKVVLLVVMQVIIIVLLQYKLLLNLGLIIL